MYNVKNVPQSLFEDVWSPKYETTLNVKGAGVERGARAITKKAYMEQVPTLDQKEAAFDAILNNPGQSFKRVAFAMQTPLKDRNDYVAVGRKLLLTDELPQGEIPAYDLDVPEFPAIAVGPRGNPPVMEANIQRIFIPTFSINITSSVHYEEIQIRRFPAFDRAKERTAIANAITEDDQVFSLLDQAVAVGPNTALTNATGPADRANMVDLLGVILSRQLAPGAYVMHPTRYTDILKWGSDQLDQVSLNVIVETGQYGVLHGVRMILSTRVNPRKVYLTTTPDKLGRIPERKAVEVKVVDWPKDTRYYITSWEQVGFGIHNTAGVACLNLTAGTLPVPAQYPLS